MLKLGILSKTILTVATVLLPVLIILTYILIGDEEDLLLREKASASEQLAKPVLHAIYKDMLDGRAEMARYLIGAMKEVEGVVRFQVIRGNGVEAAFVDRKTLDAVGKTFGVILPEWETDHVDVAVNRAEGVDAPGFVKFYDKFKNGDIVSGSHYIESFGDKRLATYVVPIERRPGCDTCHSDTGSTHRGILMISQDLDEVYATLSSSKRRLLGYSFLALLAVSLALSFLFRVIISRPIGQTVSMLNEMAEGKGDLTMRLEASSGDEMGVLEGSFNDFVDGLQEMVRDIAIASDELTRASESLAGASTGIKVNIETEVTTASDVLTLLFDMDTSIKEVSDNADSLLVSAEGSSASTLEMSATVTEVADNTHMLAVAAGDTASAIGEIAASLKQVAGYVDTLLSETEQVGSATTEIDSTIKQVATHSREQAQLAERVKEQALTIGMESVEKTRAGIEKIREEVSNTASVVDRLGKMSSEIGKIVGVIDEVADTTNLLAFNATILAAQAGEHGKGFAVVADEVKDLSDRTTASTKEIGQLIKQVRSEVDGAVNSMESSLTSVEEGMALSKDAAGALDMIVKSAEDSVDMAKRVEKATVEQARGISLVAESIFKITGMVEEIKRATDEQSRASEGISSSTEKVKDSTQHVEQSSIEQSKELKHLSEVIADVAEKMKAINSATTEQKSASTDIVKKFGLISELSASSSKNVLTLDEAIKTLNEHAAALKRKMSRFKV